jgi:hypothetical protein
MRSRLSFLPLLLVLAPLPAAAQRESSGRQTTSNPGRDVPRAKSGRGASISGRVTADGRPAANISVLMTAAGVQLSGFTGGVSDGSRAVKTEEDGSFSFDDIGEGVYTLSVEVQGYIAESGLAAEDGRLKYYRPGDYAGISLTKGGVITGTITGASGSPVVGIGVGARRIKDAEGHAVSAASDASTFGDIQEWSTDDRGIYRIHSLRPGKYIMSAGGQGVAEAYSKGAPVYYPSATRDTAFEVLVNAGEEITGIDIQYRQREAHAITGQILGGGGAGLMDALLVLLLDASTGLTERTAGSIAVGGSARFGLYGVADGEYDIIAIMQGSRDVKCSPPQRVKVRGADVTGINLTLTTPAQIAGHLELRPLSESSSESACKTSKPLKIGEVILQARLADSGKQTSPSVAALGSHFLGGDPTPDRKGGFSVRLMNGGRYRIGADLPDERWYVERISLPSSAAGKGPVDGARDGITVRAGERVTDVTVTLAEGAGSVSGRVIASQEVPGNSRPRWLRVILIPVEREFADGLLRYAETTVKADGTYSLTNIPPGRYSLIARAIGEDEWQESPHRPRWWDVNSRAILRREAEISGNALELVPCQRLKDYTVTYRGN